MRKRSILPFFIRPFSCAPRCTFCHPLAGSKKSNEAEITPALIKCLVKSQLRAQSESAPPLEIGFYGGPLGISKEKLSGLLAAVGGFLHCARVRGVRVTARPDQLSPMVLRDLQQCGVETIELDLPSLCESVLARMGPAHALPQVERAIESLEAADMVWGAQIQPGLPGAVAECDYATVDRLISYRPGFVRIYPALVLKGTWLERFYLRGSYHPLTLGEAVRLCRALADRLAGASIPVARMGLQPMRDLDVDSASVVGGPFHPSLRSLVESERMFDKAAEQIRSYGTISLELRLLVASESESHMRGQENSNLGRLLREFGLRSIRVAVRPGILPGEVLVERQTHVKL